ncbi:hypothetical protein GCM10027074_34750 [Streptomyces deserti]
MSDEQADALERILSGREGGPFGQLTQFYGEYLGMERSPMSRPARWSAPRQARRSTRRGTRRPRDLGSNPPPAPVGAGDRVGLETDVRV